MLLLKSGHQSILLFITVKNNGAPQLHDKDACKLDNFMIAGGGFFSYMGLKNLEEDKRF